MDARNPLYIAEQTDAFHSHDIEDGEVAECAECGLNGLDLLETFCTYSKPPKD